VWINKKLYSKVVKSLPIACVDILIKNNDNELLLVKRQNNPKKNCWWLPGGRVKHGEKREAAAKRKANEECGLKINQLINLGTFEIFFKNHNAHSITTVYSAKTIGEKHVQLDKQGIKFCWVSNTAIELKKSPKFVQMIGKIERSRRG
jgi:ADP-ribose pyrophosphatase YjhB (NUDIX family)